MHDVYKKPDNFSVTLCPEEPRSWGRSEGSVMFLSSLHPRGIMQPPQHWGRQRGGTSACPTPRTSLSALCRLLHFIHTMCLQLCLSGTRAVAGQAQQLRPHGSPRERAGCAESPAGAPEHCAPPRGARGCLAGTNLLLAIKIRPRRCS